ncbi:CP26A-like protein [Mya arenaria]|uniref:CP26A-like protein n=1 Tax=Mya arenaria TaxID=6604 RepID=A0ABY7FP23_MYAAR|nr:CP26A-like protein [Mya arenaria]
MEIITGSLIAITVLMVIYMWKQRSPEAEANNLPPGSLGLPVIGESISFAIKKVAFFKERHERFGRIFKTNLFGKRTVRVYGADNIRKLVSGEGQIVRSSYPTSVRKLLGDQALSMSHGDVHKEKKTQLMKYLSPEFFHNHCPILANTIAERVQKWQHQSPIDIHFETRKLFMELAARFLINIDITGEVIEQLMKELEIFTDNVFCLPFNIPGFGFHKVSLASCSVSIIVCNTIKQKLATKAKLRMREIIASSLTESVNNNDTDGLSSVLQGLKAETNDVPIHENYALLDSIIDLLFSGSETVSSAGFSLLHQLSKHENVSERLRQEAHSHGLVKLEEPVCARDVQDMPFVDAVVKETLRILPPVGGAFREGYTIPKGWTVVFGIRETHERDSTVTSTSTFLPERWLHDKNSSSSSPTMFPFGGGARVCPGQAYAKMILKLFTVELSRSSALELVQDSPLCFWPSPKPVNKVLVNVTRL